MNQNYNSKAAKAGKSAANAYTGSRGMVGFPSVSPHQLVSINKNKIYPTGKNGLLLWEYVKLKLPYPHGIRKYFTFFVKGNDSDYKTNADFHVDFSKWLSQQEKQTKKGKKPVLKKDLKLNRPAWPQDYKELLNIQVGDNIRHVVRNATLKNAIFGEYETLKKEMKEEDLITYYRKMHELVLETDPGKMHSFQILRLIYNAAYLHIGNLFAGPGGDNQVIGLAADPITILGEKLVAKGNEQVNIIIAFSEAMDTVKNIKLKKKELAEQALPLQKMIIGVMEDMIRSYQVIKNDEGEEEETKYASAEDIGYDLIDIGLSLGFDLIDERDDRKFSPDRQKNLLKVETALQNKQFKSGNHSLTDIIRYFLRIN